MDCQPSVIQYLHGEQTNIYLAHKGMCNDFGCQGWSAFPGHGNKIKNARRKSRLFEELGNEGLGSRAVLGRFQDHSVSAQQWHCDCADRQSERGVPRCDRKSDEDIFIDFLDLSQGETKRTSRPGRAFAHEPVHRALYRMEMSFQ